MKTSSVGLPAYTGERSSPNVTRASGLPLDRCPISPAGVVFDSAFASLPRHYFRIHRLDQRFDVPVTEGERLQAPRVIGVARHVIGADGAGELHVAQDSHHLEEIHLALIGVNLLELPKP